MSGDDVVEVFSKEWVFCSQFGDEKEIMQGVSAVINSIVPGEQRLDDIMTVIAEACLNAIEHGNGSNASLPVLLEMKVDEEKYKFRIFDQGAHPPIFPVTLPVREIWLKDSPRGWGLLFIRQLSDRFSYGEEAGRYYVEIIFNRRRVL